VYVRAVAVPFFVVSTSFALPLISRSSWAPYAMPGPKIVLVAGPLSSTVSDSSVPLLSTSELTCEQALPERLLSELTPTPP